MWPPSTVKIDNVTIDLAAAPTGLNATDRREHCLVSQQILDDLARTQHPVLGVWGQIRIAPATAGGRPAVFTIAGINGQAGHVVSVYPDVPGGAVGGPTKLFTSPIPAALGTGRVVASPSSTVTRVPSGGLPQTVTVWPAASGGEFVETIVMGDSELLVAAPHGGSIETGTAEQAQYLISKMATLCPTFGAPTVWYCQGQFTAANFNRLHITSTDIDERTFAALDEAWKAAPYQGPVRYRYAVALHGMSGDTLTIVLGGRLNTAERDLVSQKISAKFPATANLVIQTEVAGVGGSSPNNFINRLSENVPPSASTPFRLGRGGIQIEQSLAVRTGTDPISGKLYRDLVVDGLGEALTELLGRNRIYVRDHLADDGTLLAAPPSYMSPDVCIRVTAPTSSSLSNKGVALENEEIPIGTSAKVYVRAYNANPIVPLSDVHAHVYDSVPSTLVQPDMWNPLGVVALGTVGSNTTPKVGSCTIPAVSTPGHRCLVCILADEPYDLVALKGHAIGWSITQFTDFIRRSRLAAWRNYQAVTVADSSSMDLMVPGYAGEDLEFRVEVGMQMAELGVQVALIVPAQLYAQLNMERSGLPAEVIEKGVKVTLPLKTALELGRGILPSRARHACRFEVRVPKGTSKLGTLHIRQIYTPQGRPEVEVGRVTWELRRPATKPSGRKPTGTLESGRIRGPKLPDKPPARPKKSAAAKKPAPPKKPTPPKKPSPKKSTRTKPAARKKSSRAK